MSTSMLPKYCIFAFPPNELSKIKHKSDHLGNEMSDLRRVEGGVGTFKKTQSDYKIQEYVLD